MKPLLPDQIFVGRSGEVKVESDYWSQRQSDLQAISPQSTNESCNNMSNCGGSTNGNCQNNGRCQGAHNILHCTDFPKIP